MSIVSMYKKDRKLDKDKGEIFDFKVNIYGYITLILSLYWTAKGWGTWIDSDHQQMDHNYYIQTCKKYMKDWTLWTDKIVQLLQS